MEIRKNSLSASIPPTDPWLDAAACDALGASTPAESATYQQQLAAQNGGEEARRIDRELRDTVARIAAASPHMTPPSDLRGKILQATAPATFKMEDYRKATRDHSKFYRWGFYAAVFFLMIGATYNVAIKSALQRTSQQAAALAQQSQQFDAALKALVSPDSLTVIFKEDGKEVGRALVSDVTHQGVVILPKEMIPEGKTVQQLTLPRDGKEVVYQVALITAPANTVMAPSGRQTMEAILHVKTMLPDNTPRTTIAGQ